MFSLITSTGSLKTVTIAQVIVAICLTLGFLGAATGGQEAAAISLASEPHHHLALHNEYVNVYQVKVAPGDSVQLHRHDTDAISLSLSESLVTVHSPGRPDVQQKLVYGQIRLQARGYVHSTRVDGATPFRNVTVELLLPQTGARNGCFPLLAGQPLNCFTAIMGMVPMGEFETDQTDVSLIMVAPYQRVVLGEPAQANLVVALDGGATHSGETGRESSLGVGEFVWLDRGKAGETFRNGSGRGVRFIIFAFKLQSNDQPGTSN